jgi:hypothetical protein
MHTGTVYFAAIPTPDEAVGLDHNRYPVDSTDSRIGGFQQARAMRKMMEMIGGFQQA